MAGFLVLWGYLEEEEEEEKFRIWICVECE